MNSEVEIPKHFILSLLLGVPFLSAWIGFAAMAAKDGREPVTDWLDPMLAGLTLTVILFVQLVFLIVWPHIKDSRLKKGLQFSFMISQWFYIFGEILSNTITIGEPPQDIGSIFEIASGVILLLSSIVLISVYKKVQFADVKKRGLTLLLLLAISLFLGMAWWFIHPIDQSKPGAPEYISGNPVYNFFHSFVGKN